MPTFTYTFTNPPNTVITVTTENTPRTYDLASSSGGGPYSGYAVTGISGTLNGQAITGLVAAPNTSTNPLGNDTNGSGGNIGLHDNVIWINDTQGNAGQSYYGLDNRGLGFTAGGTDYKLYKPSASSNSLVYSPGTANGSGLTQNATTIDAANSTPPCYVTGTLIRTSRGDVAVEALAVGDLAVTASGEHRPIRWIGHRLVESGRHDNPAEILPVRISAGALGENRPSRDLLVSPGHAICVDVLGEVLIPAVALVNGSTIRQEDAETVTYWHVELDSHDILIAEGQPAESYLDMGNRSFFAESGVIDFTALPDAEATARSHADFCRPFHAAGAVVDAVRAQIQVRAGQLGWRLDDQTWAGMHLLVDGRRLDADTRDLTARFVVPASAGEIWLMSETIAPRDIGLCADGRQLGLCVQGIAVDDGLAEPRSIELDDPRLGEGFYDCEEGMCRWTSGRARIPLALLEGCRGTAFLRIALARGALPRWVMEAGPVARPALRVVADAA